MESVYASSVTQMVDHLRENQQLQELAQRNGLEFKNNIDFTDDTIKNVVTGMLSLAIAKNEKDPRYDLLKRTGEQKRSLKTEIINTHKDRALMVIDEMGIFS